MRYLTLFIMLLSFGSLVLAQDVVQKSGNDCPSGYRDGKGHYCYQSSNYNNKKLVVKEGRECPSGYRYGKGGYCYGRSSADNVIVKEEGGCPRGYRDGPGKYCYD